MKIAIVSNYINHHAAPLCHALYAFLGEGFAFVETESRQKSSEGQAYKMGYAYYMAEGKVEPWVISGEKEPERARQVILDADVVLTANTSDDWVFRRLKAGKLTFRAHERWYRKKLPWHRFPKAVIGGWLHHGRFRNLHMLCASAYTAADAVRVGCFRGKAYRWGYFPEFREYSSGELAELKSGQIPTILWAGRLIVWKHADDAVAACIRLKQEGFRFRLAIAGDGPKLEKLRAMAQPLEASVRFLGALTPEALREEMEKSLIFLFTSDRQEGWGAVLNEAMNSGCAVVASHEAGATPYLVSHRENGLIYPGGDVDALVGCIRCLLADPQTAQDLGLHAYETIRDQWQPGIAAARLIALCESLLQGNGKLPEQGPCSPASVMKNDWFPGR